MKLDNRMMLSAMTAAVAMLYTAQASAQVDADCTGNNPGTVTCTGVTTYANGVTHNATAGNLTVNVGENVTSFGSGGFNTTATGSNSVTMTKGNSGNMLTPAATGTTATTVIGASTENGDVSITTGTGTVQGVATTAQYGIRAHSSGSGDISITTGGAVSQGGTAANPGIAAIAAQSNGGEVLVTTNGNVTGRQYGILAATSGAGGVQIDVNSGIVSMSTTSGVGLAAIHATAAGDIAINIKAGSVNGGNGVGILVDGGGTSTINLMQSPPVQLGPNVNPDPLAGNSGIRGAAAVVRGLGNSLVLNVSTAEDFVSPTRLAGRLDFSALTGTAELNIGDRSVWRIDTPLATASVFSNGADRVWIAAGGMAVIPAPSNSVPLVVDFSGGNDQLLNEGLIRIEGPRSELHFLGLERLVNVGIIDLGEDPCPTCFNKPDLEVPDDILMLPGTTLVGTEAGRIRLDTSLRAFEVLQDRCSPALRGTNGRLPVSDCIALHDGSIEGTVFLEITPDDAGGRGVYNPDGNVIVDLSDGNGGAGSGGLADGAAVLIAPESPYYSPAFGGVLDNGMFIYRLIYDEIDTQVKLVSIPAAGAFHQPIIANAAQSAWRTANASFFDRQADLRDTLRASSIQDNGVWLRTAYDDGERTPSHTFRTPTGDAVYDNTHDLQTSAVTLGLDVLRGSDGNRRWLVGGMAGYVRTDVEYAQLWTDTAAMNGMMVGLYGSFIDGPLFVDAAISRIWAQLDQDMPQADLFRGRGLTTDIETTGAQVEAGWRFELGSVRVEPLLNASWTQTSVEDIKVSEGDPMLPGNQVMFDDTTSTRIGAGLRGSTQFPVFGSLQLGLSLTGRVMSERDGEAKARIGNLNPISPEVVDTWDGTFSEFIGGVTLANSTGRVSGVLNVGLRSGDDYSATSGSFGFRYQW